MINYNVTIGVTIGRKYNIIYKYASDKSKLEYINKKEMYSSASLLKM